MQTKTELTLEQTQQGVSDKVLVSIEEVEECKRKVKIKVKRKKPSLYLGRNQVDPHGFEDSYKHRHGGAWFQQNQRFIATCSYSTDISTKKTRGKGSKGKKQTVTPKKKSSIFVKDNIIPEPDVVLELGKSMSKTKAKISEEERRLHETHEHLVIAKATGVDESDCKHANRTTRRSRPSGVDFRDTSNMSKKKSLDWTQKLKGIQVPNEGKGSLASKADAEIDWGSKDDSHQSNDEHVNEGDITWLSTDGYKRKTKMMIKKMMIDIVAEKLEEEKGDEEEEQANDDQA
ncbi:hypothetical protein Tco_1367644 [Tanacetum coccineum]